MFNTLRYTQVLEDVGITRKQAETHIEVMSEIAKNHFATREDFRQLKLEIDKRFLESENRLTLRMGGLFAAQTTLFTVLMTILKFL